MIITSYLSTFLGGICIKGGELRIGKKREE